MYSSWTGAGTSPPSPARTTGMPATPSVIATSRWAPSTPSATRSMGHSSSHDNILLGSSTMDATALRTIEVDGARYAYYWLAEREGAIDSGRPIVGVLGTPKLVGTDGRGRLILRAAPQTDTLFGDPVALGVAAFSAPRATDRIQAPGTWPGTISRSAAMPDGPCAVPDRSSIRCP